MRLSSPITCVLVIALAGAAYADDTVQPPQLAAPQRASLAGEYGKVAFGPADVDRGGFTLAAPMSAPGERGALQASVFPSYSNDAGISEWGVGWGTGLSITRTRILGSLDYATDDLTGPWGRMVRGGDGCWYAVNLGGHVRLEWREPVMVATLPSGDRLTFGGDDRFANDRGTFTWYLTDVEALDGRRTHLTWSGNAPGQSGRRFLQSVQYGGRGSDFAYQIDFTYEATQYLFVSYLSGVANTLDRRVRTVTVRARNAAGGSFDERWHYTLDYLEEGMGPAFYLRRVTQSFPGGASPPPALYGYRLAAAQLPGRSFQRSAVMDALVGGWGADIIQPTRSSILDADDDGRTDLEEAGGNTLLRQTDQGYVAEPLPAKPVGASPLCRRNPSRLNAPRTLADAIDGGDGTRVLGVQSNATHTGTEIDLCERDGRLLAQQFLTGYWQPSKNVKLVDLDRDRKPDLISIEYGRYTVLPNVSESGQLEFDAPRQGFLSPALTPTASYVQDINGDGIPDLVARNNASVTVWLGSGGYGFLTEGQQLDVRGASGQALGSLDRFDFHFLDINRDGLADLLLTNSTSSFLFVNNGYTFLQVDLPALGGLASGASPPVVADLTGSGNSTIALTLRGQAYALELDDAGVGLMTSADDGRGNVLTMSYARGPAATGAHQRPSVLATLTVATSGQGPITYAYSYRDPEPHSQGKFLLGYDSVTRSDPQSSQTMSLLNDDDAQGVVLGSTSADRLLPSVRRFVVNSYEATTYQDIRWMRLKSARTGFGDAAGTQTAEERVDYVAYDVEICPRTVQTTKAAGTLTTVTTRADVSKLAGALHCLPDTVTETGTHLNADARWNFQQQKHFTRNELGLQTSVESLAADGAVQLQSVVYNPDYTVASVAVPGHGVTTAEYDPATHLPWRVVNSDGVVWTVTRSPLTDSVTSLTSDRGGGNVYTQWFRFDAMERLTRAWDNLGQSSEAQPTQALGYRYATATQPAATAIDTLVDARSGAVVHTVDFTSGSGAAVGTASLIPEGWVFSKLRWAEPAAAELTESLRPTLAPGSDPMTLDRTALFAGATPVSDTVTVSGKLVSGWTLFHADVRKDSAGTLQVASGRLVDRSTENGRYTTVLDRDAGQRVVAHTDPGGSLWSYRYDALDRLRAVVLPDYGEHRVFYDAHGRVARVERDGVATLVHVYDPVSGVPRSTTFYQADGTPQRVSRWDYDAIGRKRRETNVDLIGGGESSYDFYYDGASPEQPLAVTIRGVVTAVRGDGFTKRISYRADGKVVRQRLELAGFRTLESSLDYTANGGTLAAHVQLFGPDGALLAASHTRNAFDPYGRIVSIALGDVPLATLGYDGNGQLESAQLASGEMVTWSYDGTTRLPSGLSQASRTWTAQDAYRRNERGLIAGETLGVGDHSVARSYDYSARGFLIRSDDAQASWGYDYDANGLANLVREQDETRTITRSRDHFTAGAARYALDGGGRTVGRDDLELGYGPSGQVERARRGDAVFTFKYDERGQRLLKLRDGVPVAGYVDEGVIDGDGLTERFELGGKVVGVLRNGAFEMLPLDRLGNAIGDVDGTQTLASPYGDRKVHTARAAAVEYVKKGYDADLGLVRMGVRDYDPRVGQFLTPDPVFLAQPDQCVRSPIECNLYSYAGDDPLGNTDPSGTCIEDACLVEGAVVLFVAHGIAQIFAHSQAQQSRAATAPSIHMPKLPDPSMTMLTLATILGIKIATSADKIDIRWDKTKTGEEGHHTIPRALMSEMAEGGMIDVQTLRYLWPANRPGTLKVDRPTHLAIHKGLTVYLMSQHPALVMVNGFQTGDNWAAYVKVLDPKGDRSPVDVRDQIIKELGSYYNNLPLVPTSNGVESPRLKFTADALRVLASPAPLLK